MPEIKIFHNPRCSKSRAALSLLKNAALLPKWSAWIRRLTCPVRRIFSQWSASARGMMRVKDDLYGRELAVYPDLDTTRCCVPSPSILPCWSVRLFWRTAVARWLLENIEAIL